MQFVTAEKKLLVKTLLGNVILVESYRSRYLCKRLSYKMLFFCMITRHQYFEIDLSAHSVRNIVLF